VLVDGGRLLTYRKLEAADFEAAARLLVAAYPYRSHEPASWHAPAPHERPRRWGVWLADGPEPSCGEMVGYASLWIVEERKCRFDVVVRSQFLRQGIGRRLFDSVLREARTIDAATLQARAVETNPEALAFLSRRAFRETMRMHGFVLDVSTPNRHVLEASAASLDGVSICAVTSERILDLRFWDELTDLHQAAQDGWPDPDPGGPRAPLLAETLRTMLIPNDVPPLAFFVASRSDRLVGYSALVRSRTADEAQFAATAVRPDARGRGIATAIRARCLIAADSAGCKTVRSASGSAALIRINSRFGFQPTHCEVRLVRAMDATASRPGGCGPP
jgi:GNAT superfamily N-acetyltransferase